MSASLVGSEMCIRDRPKRAATRTGRIDCAGRGRSEPRTPRCSWAANAAVSYTHLTLPTICSV
eukprot:7835174-Alexandrium_andersonii.AAC.1